MDYQMLFNIAVAIAGMLGGWVLGRITKALDQLDADVRAMPTNYVSKADYYRDVQETRNMLRDLVKTVDDGFQRIYDKIDGKADK